MAAARNVVLLVLFAGLWLLWSGHFEPMTLTLGALSCVFTVWLAARMEVNDEEGYPLSLWPRFVLTYLPWLLWQILKSNLEVAWIIVQPKLPISPSVYTVTPSAKSVMGQVMLANSITITPGTISLDLRDGRILVHSLTGVGAEVEAEDEMNRRVKLLEGNV